MKDLEKELRALKPSSPSSEFKVGLEEALGEPGKLAVKRTPDIPAEQESILSSGFFRLSLFLGITSTLAVALYLANTASNDDVPVEKPSSFIPATEQDSDSLPVADQDASPLHGISNASIAAFAEQQGWNLPEKREILVGATDEGIVDRPGQAPARRYRYRFLDETIWRNPATNTFIHSAIPREEIVLVGLDPY